ncbi:hypothetical protein BCR44DRAFT_23387 [Catenaria anguillulae PL171]|uniref:Uncharacterized protein n=1 Tax=Catenaria anguillulae PL171 TaxID=765915 RepID=A0A1Y2H899_9FUNG|nr:hypothetical protein BCR44DRAFT_23387 [Catenaria anguillulae PL171]
MFNRVTTVTDTDIKRRQLPGTVQEDVFQRRMFVPQKDGCFMGQTASMTRETPDGVPGSLIDIDSYLRYETRRQTGILFDEPATETPGFFSNEIQYASCDLQIEPERQKLIDRNAESLWPNNPAEFLKQVHQNASQKYVYPVLVMYIAVSQYLQNTSDKNILKKIRKSNEYKEELVEFQQDYPGVPHDEPNQFVLERGFPENIENSKYSWNIITNKLTEVSRDLNSDMSHIDSLMGMVDSIMTTLAQVKSHIETKNEFQNVQNVFSNKLQEIESFKTEITRLNAHIQQLEQDKKSLNEEIETALNYMEWTHGKRKEIQNRIAEIESSLYTTVDGTKKRKIQHLTDQVANLNAQQQEIQQQITNATHALGNAVEQGIDMANAMQS